MSFVVLWANNVVTTGHAWPGHAAMNIGPLKVRRRTEPEEYVSWWPLTTETKTESARGTNHEHVIDDVCSEGYLPDYVFRLADDDGRNLRMRAVWNEIRRKRGAHYRLYAKNCSTIVARVLRAGGFTAGGGVSGAWREHSLIWTPLKIATYVEKAGGTLLTWDQFRGVLTEVGINTGDFISNVVGSKRYGKLISKARDRRYCKTGAECEH
jgi:hypothetical protein